MRLRACLLGALVFSTGCAAVFRDSKVRVHVDSEPGGADVQSEESPTNGARTPTEVELDRGGSTELTVSKPGYTTSHAAVPKKLNAGWAVADVATCVIPVALCIPLLVDALTGAWQDVDARYRVRLQPEGSAPPGGLIVVPPPNGAEPPGSPPPWSPPPAGDGGVDPGTIQL
ncbi:MAG TPA: PEGA domain-containing protein [Labilithrix sp.]|jgi:hypothetical protein